MSIADHYADIEIDENVVFVDHGPAETPDEIRARLYKATKKDGGDGASFWANRGPPNNKPIENPSVHDRPIDDLTANGR